MKNVLSFDDVLLVPADFSTIRSRKDVSTAETLAGVRYEVPIVASNMTSVYSPKLSQEIAKAGGAAVVHRFCSIEENVKLFQAAGSFDGNPWVSVGVSLDEFERAETLVAAGAEVVLIDLANGASIQAVEQYRRLKEVFKSNISVVVGNFGTKGQIDAFVHHGGSIPDLFKVSIGSGAACTTRVVTGVGLPSFSSLRDCVSSGHNIMFDGGLKSSGDVAKALAAGAKGVMLGRLFAACSESGAESKYETYADGYTLNKHLVGKVYKGSASLSSYKDQGKEASFRSPEGESYLIPVSGTIEQLMNNLSGGLRSSMSYLNAHNLNEFRDNAEFVQASSSSLLESFAHGASK